MKSYLAKLTIFLGSFLIFGIQPMVGRTLLPVFGGTAAVWVVCLCAFQVFLLGGYWYADWLARRGKSKRVGGHLVLLILAAVWTAVVALKRNTLLNGLGAAAIGGNPALEVLFCVFILVGVPYMLLGSNSSLVQVFAGGNYRLYSLSNAGSLLGLLAYPFIFEPYVTLTAQWLGFAIGIAIYALLLWRLSAGGPIPSVNGVVKASPEPARPFKPILYFLLPAVSCFLLNALTTHVTLDVMPMPLIWTVSLGLFLCSYIVGFSGMAEKLIAPFGILSVGFLVILCWMSGHLLTLLGLPLSLGAYGAFLFFACTFLHAWLYSVRPNGEKLTRYYLLQSVGGAVGGVIASLAFPLLAKTIVEYPVALCLVGIFAIIGLWISTLRFSRMFAIVALLACGFGVWLYQNGAGRETRPVVYRARGFFGTIEVLEAKARTAKGEGTVHEFVHGTTVHGIQANLPGKERMPTTYYTPNASGYAIAGHPKYRRGEPMRVNITGLGVGVLFCYGRPGDYYRAYEISQDALDVAMNTNLFTFVADCPAKKEIVLQDARKGLEAELAAGVEPYDVIVVDAFTGDNLPYHLSTVEAFDLYFKLLKPDGILCVNISNWHLGLEPFMAAVGNHYQCPLLGLMTQNDYSRLQFASKIAIFCRQPDSSMVPPYGRALWQAMPIDFSKVKPMENLPTDEKGSFIGLVKWKLEED